MTHASTLEVVWLMLASSGWLTAGINFFEARFDWIRFRHSQLPEQRFLTRAIYQGSKIIWTKHTVSVMAASWAVTHVPPPPVPDATSTQMLGTTIAWVLVSIGMTTQAILALKWRRQLSTGNFDGSPLPAGGRRRDDKAAPLAEPVIDPPQHD